jgi:tRNA(fMet)-specific endonuclease VapC
MMFLLDTDHLSIMDQDTGAAFNLGRRLAGVPPDQAAVTIITYEGQMRGWLARAAQADTTAKMTVAYARLLAHIDTLMVTQMRLLW